MKGEQQEERVPNFIGNAVIILTASHLGCEVEMVATAQEVWRTKRLPEAVLLGHVREGRTRGCVGCLGREAWRNRRTVSERVFYKTGGISSGQKTGTLKKTPV